MACSRLARRPRTTESVRETETEVESRKIEGIRKRKRKEDRRRGDTRIVEPWLLWVGGEERDSRKRRK